MSNDILNKTLDKKTDTEKIETVEDAIKQIRKRSGLKRKRRKGNRK